MLDTESDQGAERRSSSVRIPNVLRAITEAPWAVRRETLDVVIEVASLRAAGQRFTEEQISERIGAGPSVQSGYSQQGAIAVIPIYGVIMPRATLFSQFSGGTSLTSLQQKLKAAANDDQVASILLDVNSPGGSVQLVPETAALIRQVRTKKPVVAIANTDAASAAYWLASQADELWVTTSGFLGSIGVYMVHDDYSAFNDKLGVKITYIAAGKFKVDGNPDEPLSETARGHMEQIVGSVYNMFVGDVAKGRNVATSAVQNGFGQGRMVMASEAVAEGMADKVGTFDDALQALAGGKVGRRPVQAADVAPELEPDDADEDEVPEVEPDPEELDPACAPEDDDEELAADCGEDTATAVDPAFARYF